MVTRWLLLILLAVGMAVIAGCPGAKQERYKETPTEEARGDAWEKMMDPSQPK